MSKWAHKVGDMGVENHLPVGKKKSGQKPSSLVIGLITIMDVSHCNHEETTVQGAFLNQPLHQILDSDRHMNHYGLLH